MLQVLTQHQYPPKQTVESNSVPASQGCALHSSCHFWLKIWTDSTLTHLSIHPDLVDFKEKNPEKPYTHIKMYLSR